MRICLATRGLESFQSSAYFCFCPWHELQGRFRGQLWRANHLRDALREVPAIHLASTTKNQCLTHITGTSRHVDDVIGKLPLLERLKDHGAATFDGKLVGHFLAFRR